MAEPEANLRRATVVAPSVDMTYAEANAYLLGTIDEGTSPRLPARLERMRSLLRELGDPQHAYPAIHIGGTSGKGSTSTMVAAALSASGKRVGLHTKPHVTSVCERMRVDGVPIEPESFARLMSEAMPALDRVARDDTRPTYYETLLALSLLYFARERVDVAVVEVGLGGRLDGTNVLEPVVSAITNVGLDHVEVLGDTVEAIARDKVGIAKPGVPLISDVADGPARVEIEAGCARAGTPFISVRERARVEPQGGSHLGQALTVVTGRARYVLALPVLGGFQRRNAATAIVLLENLPEALRPAPQDVERGLAGVAIAGRMEYFASHPSIVFDIAHNADKAGNLADALREEFPDRRFTFVAAISESKDAAAIVAPLARLPASFVFTTFEATGRPAIRPQRLTSMAAQLGAAARAIADPLEALAIARRTAGADDVVVVTGSTFIVSTLRAWWLENAADAARRN